MCVCVFSKLLQMSQLYKVKQAQTKDLEFYSQREMVLLESSTKQNKQKPLSGILTQILFIYINLFLNYTLKESN